MHKSRHMLCLPEGNYYMSLFSLVLGCFVVSLPKGTEGSCKHTFQKYKKIELKVYTMENMN